MKSIQEATQLRRRFDRARVDYYNSRRALIDAMEAKLPEETIAALDHDCLRAFKISERANRACLGER